MLLSEIEMMRFVTPVLLSFLILTVITSTQALETKQQALQARATQQLKITVNVPVQTTLNVDQQKIQGSSNARDRALVTESVEATSLGQTKVYTATAL